jgi:urease accessory protein
VSELAGCEPWRPRVLPVDGEFARVALVQTRESLIAGDDISLELCVGDGAALELCEIGATLAHDVRGGAPARVSVSVSVADGGRLIWLGRPLIVAAGCCVGRSTFVALRASARVLLGEAVVLGRAGAGFGCATVRTRIECGGQPLLDETLDTGDAATVRAPVIAGGGRMLAGCTLAGVRDDDPPAGCLSVNLLLRRV